MIKQLEFQINNQLCSESEKKWANPTACGGGGVLPVKKTNSKAFKVDGKYENKWQDKYFACR